MDHDKLTPPANTEWPRYYNLKNGQKLSIDKFLGKHVRLAAVQLSENKSDSTAIIMVLMSMLCKIDGKGLPPEDWDEMDGAVMMEVMERFNEVNPM